MVLTYGPAVALAFMIVGICITGCNYFETKQKRVEASEALRAATNAVGQAAAAVERSKQIESTNILLRIELAKLQWRSISPAQSNSIVVTLKRAIAERPALLQGHEYASQRVTVVFDQSDDESTRYAKRLVGIVRAAGLTAGERTLSSFPTPDGQLVGLALVTGDKQSKELLSVVSNALKTNGITPDFEKDDASIDFLHGLVLRVGPKPEMSPPP